MFALTLAVGFAAFYVWLTVRIVNRRERWTKRTAVAALVAAPFLYGIAYLLLMNPIWVIRYFGGDWERHAIYRGFDAGDESVAGLFKLAHNIDRRVRPDFWSEKKPFRGGRQP